MFTSHRYAKHLDNISGVFFFVGVVSAKAQYVIPIPFISLILNSVGLGLYFLAYISWFTSIQLNPDHRHNKQYWYGKATLKQQLTIASVLGFIATMLGVIAIFCPFLIIPTCWLFTISNLCWFWGEYHKTNSSPEHPEVKLDYSQDRQENYFKYVKTVIFISIMTSILTTIAFFFPSLIILTLIIGPYLGGIAIKAWVDMTFYLSKPRVANPSLEQRSVETMTNQMEDLGWVPVPIQELELALVPSRKSPLSVIDIANLYGGMDLVNSRQDLTEDQERPCV